MIPSKPPPPRFWQYLWRGMRLRCPECGVSPVFVKARQVRTLHDWLTPLCGCPRCGYAYEREAGYFLGAIWGIHYCVVAGMGLAGGLLADLLFHVSLPMLAASVCLPAVAFSFVFIRWSKSIYLAMDHYLAPHVRESDLQPRG